MRLLCTVSGLPEAGNNKKLREPGYPAFTESYLKVCEMKEPPYTNPHVRWRGRPEEKISICLLPIMGVCGVWDGFRE